MTTITSAPDESELRVLLVEDNPADARLVRELFRDAGRSVALVHATRLNDAIDLLRHQNFGAVLLDLTLPDSDGFDTFSRTAAEAHDAPIVVLTGLADEQAAARAVREGAQDYLVKGQVTGALLYQSIRFAVERRNADAALRRSEARYRNLVEGSIQGIVIHVDGVIQLANEAMAALLGMADTSALVGASIWSLVADDDRPVLETYAAARRLGQPAPNHYQFRAQRDDGTRVWLDCVVSTIPWDGRQATLATAVDVTERKEAEERLRASEERFRQLSENIKEAIIIVDALTGASLYISRVWEDIWGVPLETAYENQTAWLAGIHPDDREHMVASYETVRTGHASDAVFRVVRPDRVIRWARARVFPVFDDYGSVYRIVGLIEDITDVRHTEEQLRQSQKMEAVGRLAGGIAHDFNNLLTAILGFAELALLQLDEAPPAEDLRQIIQAGRSASTLTRQLLAFSRRQVLRPSKLNVNDVLERVETLLLRVLGEDIVLLFALAPDLPMVNADAGQLEQVIMNLAVNARDAMPDGGRLTIETLAVDLDEMYAAEHPGSQTGPHVMIAVTDTGCGMDAGVLSRLFEPFFTTKEPGRGTGLGLSTVHGIVNQSQGSIWVYSEVGQGTTFKVYLPAMLTGSPDAESPRANDVSTQGVGTILVVEDQPQVRAVACSILRRNGYTVLEAESGKEAIAVAGEHGRSIDLLLSDVVMPETSGRTVAERLRVDWPHMRVLFMSGYSNTAVEQHGVLEAGVAFVEKPFSSRTLLRAVREVLASAPGSTDAERES